jgi:hypothetical protein
VRENSEVFIIYPYIYICNYTNINKHQNQPRIFKTQNKSKQTTIVSNDRQSITNHHQSTSIISNPQHSPPTNRNNPLIRHGIGRKNCGNLLFFTPSSNFEGFPSVSRTEDSDFFHKHWVSQLIKSHTQLLGLAIQNGPRKLHPHVKMETCHTKTSI